MMGAMIDLDHPEIMFAVGALKKAAHLAKQIQRDMAPKALTKEDKSPVTVADFAVQALLGRSLETAFPEDTLVAEEDSATLRSTRQPGIRDQVVESVSHSVPDATLEQVCQWIDRGGKESGNRFWTLDPIDGTKGFLRGNQYVVALALVVKGEVQIGALACPNLGRGSLIIAVRGQGCWRIPLTGPERFEKLRVSACEDPAQARLLRSFEAEHTNVGQMDELMQAMMQAIGVSAQPVLMDSQAKYAVLAEGTGDLLFRLLSPTYPDYREKIWDQAAGSLVIEEAGGRITDLDGKPLDFSVGPLLTQNRGVVASNGHLHEAALKALRAH
jgi:3'(2'), 5'-bisphosphate nucleotidase